MLLVLFYRLLVENLGDFIVEEPEAHLFPASQKRLVNIFSMLYEAGNDFLITTHSPYILTALNDSILAADLMAEQPETAARVREILGTARPIPFEEVRAYTMENGELTSILNRESRLIGTNVIDAVSDDFEHIFNALLEIKYPTPPYEHHE